MSAQLTEFQQDAISEMLNIGMGRAAASLSEMVAETVNLSVPQVELVPRMEVAKRIGEIAGDKITAVTEQFNGSFWGDAVLLFPEEKSLELVRILLKDDLPLDILSEMEQEALTEVANIILNACLGSLSNMFQNELVYNLPVFSQGSVDSIFHLSEYNEEDLVLLLRMEFNVSHHNVNGYLSLLMDVRSVQAFSEQVAKYFGQA